MATGETVHPQEPGHTGLLDEIRRRAEAAELARIEAEEQKIAASESSDFASHPLPATSSASDVATPFLELFHLQKEKPESSMPQIKPDRDEEALVQKRITDLLQSAHEHYQNERYEQSLADLEHLLVLSPGHGDAATLLRDVQKAKGIADALMAEEKRLRAEEEQSPSPVVMSHSAPAVELPSAPPPEMLFTTSPPALPDTAVHQPTHSSPEPSQRRRRLRWVSFTAICLAVGVAGTLLYQHLLTSVLQESVGVAILVHAGEAVPEHIATGIREHVADAFATRRDVKTIGVRSSEAVQGASLAQAAITLHVPFVVDLHINRTGTKYHVSFVVFDGRKNGLTATGSATLTLADLLGNQGELQQQLASALGLTQFREGTASFFKGQSDEVLEQYLLGRHLLRGEWEADTDSAISVLMKCREQAANFAPLEATLGWAHLIAFEQAGRKPVYLEEAHRRLQRSLSHGLKTALTYGLWGALEYNRDNFAGAIERFQQAQALAPGNPAFHLRMAMALLRAGRPEEALNESKTASELDPLNPRTHLQRALLLTAAKDFTGAVTEFDLAFSLDQSLINEMIDPYSTALVAVNMHERALDVVKAYVSQRPSDYVGHYNLGRLYQLAGKPKVDWMNEFRITLDIIDEFASRKALTPQVLMYKGLVQTRLGLFEEGIATGNKARALAPNDVTLLYSSARLFALQKNRTGEAIAHLGTAVGTEYILPLLLDLDLAPIRNDPRFSAIIGG